MIAVQIIVLVIQIFILYLTFVEMRKARQQQVLPFITFEPGQSTSSGKGIVAQFSLKNQGTGPAVMTRIYLKGQEVQNMAILSPGEFREFSINLTHYQWDKVPQNKEIPLTAEYENVHGRLSNSTVKLKKDPNGHPKIIEDSFMFWREKDVFEILSSKVDGIFKKLFSDKS